MNAHIFQNQKSREGPLAIQPIIAPPLVQGELI